MPTPEKHIIVVCCVLFISLLACNAPGISSPTITPSPSPTAEATMTPEVTATDEATAVPTATEFVCIYNGRFLEDVTIPDGSTFTPGEVFDKTWRMDNTGCLAWPEGTELVFLRGDRLDAAASVPVAYTAAGGVRDITVAMKAPDDPGSYQGFWQLQAPGDVLFGPEIYTEIVVPEPTGSPDLFLASFDFTPYPAISGTEVLFTTTVKNQGDAPAVASKMVIQLEGVETATLDVPALAAGATHTASVTVEYGDAGTYAYSVRLDSTNAVAESSEDNDRVGTIIVSVLTQESGSFTLPIGTCYDLDTQATTSCGAGTDFTWELSGSDRNLTPNEGALAIVGTVPGYYTCRAADLSDIVINGTAGDNNQIPAGTSLCVLTSDDRYAAITITEYGATLKVDYMIWGLEG